MYSFLFHLICTHSYSSDYPVECACGQKMTCLLATAMPRGTRVQGGKRIPKDTAEAEIFHSEDSNQRCGRIFALNDLSCFGILVVKVKGVAQLLKDWMRIVTAAG